MKINAYSLTNHLRTAMTHLLRDRTILVRYFGAKQRVTIRICAP